MSKRAPQRPCNHPLTYTAEEVYRKYYPMACRIGGKVASKFPAIPAREFAEEAVRALGELAAMWDVPGQTYFYDGRVHSSTWMYRNLYWFLTTWASREQPKYWTFSNCGSAAVAEVAKASARPGWWETLLANLGEDARVLAATLCNAPADLAADLAPRRAGTRGKPAAAAHMAGRGWDEARFERAWWEVAGAL